MSQVKVCRCQRCEACNREGGPCAQAATEGDEMCRSCHDRAGVSWADARPQTNAPR
jgi:hypothetical protein